VVLTLLRRRLSHTLVPTTPRCRAQHVTHGNLCSPMKPAGRLWKALRRELAGEWWREFDVLR
jgi:hypothetical protein